MKLIELAFMLNPNIKFTQKSDIFTVFSVISNPAGYHVGAGVSESLEANSVTGGASPGTTASRWIS